MTSQIEAALTSFHALAQRAGIDPGTLITAKTVGQLLSEEPGLTARTRKARHRRIELLLTEEDLRALMIRSRYGDTPAGGDHLAGEAQPDPGHN